jgi:glycosyltransferase involved in cell wall biosynthesis
LPALKLLIVHYHLRPGGVRRVVELATPHIVRAFGGVSCTVTLAIGEAPDQKWRKLFEQICAATPVAYFVEPGFGYVSEQSLAPAALRRSIREALDHLLGAAAADDTVVWAHNLGLARNLILTQELTRICEARGLPLLAHHHDWWFDNRWPRWPEARRIGFRSLGAVAKAVFGSTHARHIEINHADAAILKRYFPRRVTWLPNLSEPTPPPPRTRTLAAHKWLSHQLGHVGPVWLLPCRLVRRKNVAEALLLTRWLRPEAWLVTTGGSSSLEEHAYFEKLNAAARAHHWRLRLSVLAGDESGKPSVAELLAASEAVLLTSIQEGFGLPYLEAAATRRPLIARMLPNIAPDLARFGFRFPQHYEEILVKTDLFDWKAERARQTQLFRAWLSGLPHSVRRLADKPSVLAAKRQPKAVPFSRLTLTAQLEVLAQPVADSWKVCVKLNPFLETWRRRAAADRLQISPWPRSAGRWLSGENYGRSFHRVCYTALRDDGKPLAAVACQEDFIRHKLKAEFLYPLLWSEKT